MQTGNRETLRNFVVFEGIDGAGTSTQIELLKESPFAARIFATAEPTNGETGRFLRRMLGGEVRMDARTAAYLFAADRAEHLWGAERDGFNGGIAAKCARGLVCVSDRYLFSSLAYQGETCGEGLPRALNAPFPLPELLLFFDVEPEVSLARIGGRGKREIYEEEEFLRRTAEKYRQVVAEFEGGGMKVVRVDASRSVDEVRELVWKSVSALPIFKE